MLRGTLIFGGTLTVGRALDSQGDLMLSVGP